MKSQGLARIGRDARLNHTQSGTPVANFPLAFNYGRKDDQGNIPTQWVQASLWGNRAESLAQYLTKGTAIVAYLKDIHNEDFKRNDGSPGTAMVGQLYDLELISTGNRQSAPQQNGPAQQAGNQGGNNGGGAGSDGSTTPPGYDDTTELDLDVPF